MSRKPNLAAREQILTAAHGLFFARGFEGVSMDEVAGAAGIKKANLFHYYPSKEQLGLAVLDYAAGRSRTQVQAQLQRTGCDPIERVARVFDEAAAAMRKGGCRGGCFMGNFAQEMSDQNEKLRGRLEDYFVFWAAEFSAMLERARAEGYFKPQLKPKAAAEAIIALLEGAFMFCKAKKQAGPMQTAKEMALHFLESYRA